MARGIVNPGADIALTGSRPSTVVDNFTFGGMAWTSGSQAFAIHYGHPGNDGAMLMFGGTAPGVLDGAMAGITFFGGGAVSSSTWMSAIFERSGGNSQVYVDGAALGAADGTTPNSPDNIFGATAFSSTGERRVSELFFYDAVLTAAEKAAIGAGRCPMAVRLANLLCHQHLRGNESPEPDSIGAINLTVGSGWNAIAHPPIVLPQHWAGTYRRMGR